MSENMTWYAALQLSILDWYPTISLTIRGLAHMLIFLRVACYMAGPGSIRRRVVGYLSGILAGFNFAEALRIMMNFKSFSMASEPYLPGIMVIFLIFVLVTGGNMAKFLPRKVVERLP
ncbi:membrane protein [Pseudomonas phage AH02]|nr:membrane protein [Pseudomonas phage AH02]